MGDHSEAVLSLELPCDTDAPARVRTALAGEDRFGWILGDVMLVASELVTNAVLHSGCGSQHRLRVAATLDSDCLRIVVEDPGLTAGSIQRRELSEFSDAGVGLLIVDQLVERWGAERDDGYRVWAELALSRAGAPADGG